MSAALDDILAANNIDEQVVIDAFSQLRKQGWLTDPTSPGLTATEIGYLDAHGGASDNRQALLRSTVTSAASSAIAERESLTVQQASALIGISPSRVRHRIAEGSIYAYPTTGRRGLARQIPRWQFDDNNNVIAGLVEVLYALPDGLLCTEIRNFAFHAMIDRPGQGDQIPLLDWLVGGGSPEPAVELATYYLRPL